MPFGSLNTWSLSNTGPRDRPETSTDLKEEMTPMATYAKGSDTAQPRPLWPSGCVHMERDASAGKYNSHSALPSETEQSKPLALSIDKECTRL